jgi:hypothetical protein
MQHCEARLHDGMFSVQRRHHERGTTLARAAPRCHAAVPVVRRRQRVIARLSGLALAAVACATKPPPSLDHRSLVAERGWAETLRAVDEFCKLGSQQYSAMHCTTDSRGKAYIAAYEEFWPEHPIEVRVEVVSTERAAALVGEPIPETAVHHAFVFGVRVRLAKPPAGIRWNLTETAFVDGYLGENPAEVTYTHSFDDPEGFVIALGGTPRPSTIRLAKERGIAPESDARIAFSDSDRYGVERPKEREASGPSSETRSNVKLRGSDVVVLAPLAVPLAIVGILNALNPAPKGTDPAWQRYFDAIDAARKAENEVWARAPGVASRVRLWQGAWEQPSDPDTTEVLLTYGLERMGFYTPSQGYPDGDLSVFIYVRPQVGQRVLEPILVEFEIPRHGDLPDDIAAAEAKGWMPVGHDPAAEPNWRIDDHALRFDRKPPPPL